MVDLRLPVFGLIDSARFFLVGAVVFALLGVALRFAGFWFVV